MSNLSYLATYQHEKTLFNKVIIINTNLEKKQILTELNKTEATAD